MQVLLLSMPDSFEHTPTVGMRMPNGALTSLAGNVDAHHRVAVADLVLAEHDVAGTVRRLVASLKPDVVGLSAMTFQRRTALRLVRLLRRECPTARLVAGGYDPSLATAAWMGSDGVDFVVRGEGEVTFRELLRALEERRPALSDIDGLVWRDAAGAVVQNRPRDVVGSLDEVRLPRRGARVLGGYTFLGDRVDVVETSRGCTYDCSFCSIIEMRGRNFHVGSLDRVVRDLQDARAHGARVIFLVDDNITLDVRRFEALCHAIIAAGLDDLRYIVQGMTSALAAHGERLAPLMRRAGFRYVFLGIENVLDADLSFLRAGAKNAARAQGRTVGNASARAIDQLHAHGMYVVGGLIVGNPGDTAEAIEANLAFARRYVDWPYIQHPTPYPGTPMTAEVTRGGLVAHERLHEYDGTTAVVQTRSLPAEEVEFLRWRAERWMKVRHLPAALRSHPWFVLRHGLALLAHTFRGSTWRTWLGLEDARDAFRRYKALRAREREYLEAPRGEPAAGGAGQWEVRQV